MEKRTEQDALYDKDAGREQARRLSPTYDSFKQIQSSPASPWRMSLNGFWHFHLSAAAANRPKRFYENGYTVSDWDSICVPGVWQLQGYESIATVEHAREMLKAALQKKGTPAIDTDFNSIGSYKRSFALPQTWKERAVYLRFEGVKSAFRVWVNGKKAGEACTPMPAEFRIDDFLRFGEKNDVAVEVSRLCEADYLDDEGNLFLSGIFADVTLHSESKLHIWDFEIRSEVESEERARLRVELNVRNLLPEAQAVEAMLYLAQDKAGLEAGMVTGCKFEAKGSQMTNIVFEGFVEAPVLWSAENPYLYQGALVLKDFKGKHGAVKEFTFGIRTVRVKAGQFLVNGKAVLLKGVVYNAFDPDTGYTLSEERYESDLKQMKACHINAIRTCAFPHNERFYALCDRMGFYVMDEAPISDKMLEMKSAQLASGWQEEMRGRILGMAVRDMMHPSVLIWSLGDFKGYSDGLLAIKRELVKLDPSRPVFCLDDEQLRISDFLGRSHVSLAFIDAVGDLADFVDQNTGVTYKAETYREKPALLTAYAPARENGMGNLAGFRERLGHYDNWCGGFIDGFAERALGWSPEGETPLPEAAACIGIADGERRLHPTAFELQKVYQDFSFAAKDLSQWRIEICNHQYFAERQDYTLFWEILEDGELYLQGEPVGVSLKAGENCEVQLPPTDMNRIEGAEYHINLYLYEGEFRQEDGLVGWEQLPMDAQDVQPSRKQKTQTESMLKVYNRKIKVEVMGDGFEVRVSKLTGDLTSLVYDDIEFLLSPIRLNFWRVATDSDLLMEKTGFFARLRQGNWRKATQSYKVHKVTTQDLGTEVAVTVLRKVKYIKDFVETVYRIDGNGSVCIANKLTPKRDMIKFGTTMEVGGEYRRLEWFGRGIQENYWDRHTAAKVGVYNLDLADYTHNYTRPQENSNRTDIRWFSICAEEGDGLRFEDASGTLLNVSAWPYRMEDLDEASHYKLIRLRNTMTLNMDYRQQGIAIDETYERDAFRLLKNKTYAYEYKISRIY